MVSRAARVLNTGFFLLILLPLLANSAFTQIVPGEGMDSGLGGANTIVGTVLGPSGQRIARRIQVRLITATRGDRSTMTDDAGNFVFRSIPSGNYSVVIDKEKEFEPASQVVDVIQFRGSPPGTYTLNIRLIAKPNTDAAPGVLNAEFAGVPKAALDHYQKGFELAGAQDPKGAIDEFKLAVREYPDFMHAFNQIGVQRLRLNELALADAAFAAALRINPDAFAPMMNRGITLVNMKKFAEAEPVLRAVVKRDEKSPVGHYFLGQSLANQGKFDEAEKELRFAVDTGGPEMKEAHRILAIIYADKGNKPRAAGELETYLKLAPNAADAEQLRQMVLQLKGMAAPASTTPPTKP